MQSHDALFTSFVHFKLQNCWEISRMTDFEFCRTDHSYYWRRSRKAYKAVYVRACAQRIITNSGRYLRYSSAHPSAADASVSYAFPSPEGECLSHLRRLRQAAAPASARLPNTACIGPYTGQLLVADGLSAGANSPS